MIRRMICGLWCLLISLLSTASAAPPAKTPAAKPAVTRPGGAPPRKGSTPAASSTSVTRNSAKSRHAITLAQNGKALLPIIISNNASDSTKAVASELAEYLKRISGAAFEVKSGDGSTGIVVGTLAQFPKPALNKPLETKGFDGKEAFAIRTEPQRVLLIGATDLGVSHAVSRFLEFNDFGAGWTLSVAANHPVSLLLSRGRSYRHAGWMQPMYFYVPKGTKEIQYYWGEGYLHDVHGPDGKLVRTVNETGRYISIPVPTGMDGKPWHFEKLVPGHLWFFNIPNVLAASPNALLLPREVVKHDGLQMVR